MKNSGQTANGIQIGFENELLYLNADKALFWRDASLLVLSDVHFGKSDHFRKNGIPMPGNMIEKELIRIDKLLELYKPDEVLFLGDLFHSTYNKAWELVVQFVRNREDIRFSLVEGNHDIMDSSEYTRAGIHHYGLVHERPPFFFAHDRIDDLPGSLYGVFGHIHPGIKLEGPGRQKLTLPCFCFREDHLLMPAFGTFTGLARIAPADTDRIFAIADDQVFSVSTGG